MNGHIADEQLQDWLDGRLEGEDRATITLHVAACPACAREADALRSLLADLHALPRGVTPRRDLLPGIGARIDAKPAAAWSAAWLRRAAAVLFVTAVAAAVLVAMQQRTPAPPTAFERTHAEYARAAEELEAELRARRSALEPEAAAALEHSLATIDAALAEAGSALAKDPDSALLNALVLGGYERRLDVLRRAADASSP